MRSSKGFQPFTPVYSSFSNTSGSNLNDSKHAEDMNLVSELSGTIAASQPSMSYIGSQPNITSTKDAGDISLVSQPSTSIVQSQKQSQEVTCWRHWCRTSTKKILSEKKSSKSIQKGKNSGKISLASEPLVKFSLRTKSHIQWKYIPGFQNNKCVFPKVKKWIATESYIYRCFSTITIKLD